MFTRTIFIQAQPPIQIVLYFDSHSNAEKIPEELAGGLVIRDDYGQIQVIPAAAVILSDTLTDLSEVNRARGEIEIVNMRSQLKFDERIEKDAPIKAFVNRKRAEAMMKNAPRMAMPPGMPNA